MHDTNKMILILFYSFVIKHIGTFCCCSCADFLINDSLEQIHSNIYCYPHRANYLIYVELNHTKTEVIPWTPSLGISAFSVDCFTLANSLYFLPRLLSVHTTTPHEPTASQLHLRDQSLSTTRI